MEKFIIDNIYVGLLYEVIHKCKKIYIFLKLYIWKLERVEIFTLKNRLRIAVHQLSLKQ